MAPSSGHILVPKVIQAFKYAISRTAQAVRARLAQGAAQPVAIPIRVGQPVHPLAALRQSRGQSRNFSTSIRKALVETYPSLLKPRSASPTSRISAHIARSPGASTFASTLRPNLTGGTLSRTAGGYGNIAGKRMFSSVPGSQAQVINNVSAGMRAFWLGGQRGQFDGIDSVTGEKRFVAVGKRQEETARKVFGACSDEDTRGTTLEFCVTPSLSSFRKSKQQTSAGLDEAVAPLAVDFAKNLGALAAVHRDLKKLSVLGNLPISEPRPGWLAVRFAGCDGRAVESLCDELGIYRGIVREDEAWTEEQAQDIKMALLFPTAPSEDDAADAEHYFIPARTTDQPRPLTLEDTSYTAEETLSPLESIHGSSSALRGYGNTSPLRSTVSWQPNPWVDEVKSISDHDDDAHDSEKPPTAGAVRDMDSIHQFLLECDGRLR